MDLINSLNSPVATLNDFVSLLKMPTMDSSMAISNGARDFRILLQSENLISGESISKTGIIFNREIFSATFLHFGNPDLPLWDEVLQLNSAAHFLSLCDTWLDNLIEQCFGFAQSPGQLLQIQKFIKCYFQQLLVIEYKIIRSRFGRAHYEKLAFFRINEFEFTATWVSEKISQLSKNRLDTLDKKFSYTYPDSRNTYFDLVDWIGFVSKSTSEIKKDRNFNWSAPQSIAIAEANLNGFRDLSTNAKIDIFGMGSK